MSSIVQLGDVPAWIGAGTGAASLYLGLRSRRQQQATAWAAMVEELAGLTDLELRHVVEDNPVVAEIVGRAWEAAAETASEDKRRLLGRVAAAALRGDADAEIDDLQYLLRTVIALEPADISLLVVIGTPGPEPRHDPTMEGVVARDEIQARWSSPSDLLAPALSILEREGLLEQASSLGFLGAQLAGVGDKARWSLSGYGKRFLCFVLDAETAALPSTRPRGGDDPPGHPE